MCCVQLWLSEGTPDLNSPSWGGHQIGVIVLPNTTYAKSDFQKATWTLTVGLLRNIPLSNPRPQLTANGLAYTVEPLISGLCGTKPRSQHKKGWILRVRKPILEEVKINVNIKHTYEIATVTKYILSKP